MQYSDKVMDHFQHPRNVGRLDKNDPNVGTGTRGAPACGDVLSLQIKVNDNGVIEDAKFKTYGCTSAIASSSVVTELIKGKPVGNLKAEIIENDWRPYNAGEEFTYYRGEVYTMSGNPEASTSGAADFDNPKIKDGPWNGFLSLAATHINWIGRNVDYALGLEGSLKLKEISYIHSEAYASGELKHGTISLIEEGTPVIALSTYGPLFDKAMSNVVEVQARGANVLALTTETHRDAMAARTPRVLTVPDVEPMLLPQLGVAPLQLLAYYIALERGCDIDKPRNLAKSVTVE